MPSLLPNQRDQNTVKPRLHQDMLLGNMCPGRATCIRIHMLTDTCCRIQVARPGSMLTVSRQRNYSSFTSRSTCIPLYPATNWQQFCCRYKNVDGDRTHFVGQHVSWCKRGLRPTTQYVLVALVGQ